MSCGSGKILRKGYITRTGVRVKPQCVKDMGLPGKGLDIIPIKDDHFLSERGYSDVKNMSKHKRRSILRQLIKKKGHHELIGALTARSNLIKRISPEASKRFKEDQEWISSLLRKSKRKKTKRKKTRKKTKRKSIRKKTRKKTKRKSTRKKTKRKTTCKSTRKKTKRKKRTKK